MSNRIYLFPFHSETEKNIVDVKALKALLRDNYYNHITIFEPIKSEKKIVDAISLFSKDEALEMILKGQKDVLIKSILRKADELSKNCDIMVILGNNDIEEYIRYALNIEIAKNLNSNILLLSEDEILRRYLNFRCQENGIKLYDVARDEIDAKLLPLVESRQEDIVTQLAFETTLFAKAKESIKTIVLPESEDVRILKAAKILSESACVKLILLGDEVEIKKSFREFGIEPNYSMIEIMKIENSPLVDEFANDVYELRKNKGVDLMKAKELVLNRNYFGTMLIYKNYADGMVSGAVGTTADTIRPAFQIIKTLPGVSTISGAFFISLAEKVYLFADCAVTPNPTAEQLATAAIASAKTYSNFFAVPKVAMLSYSTGNSGVGPDVDLVREATEIAKKMAPDLFVEGPIQFDAAVDKDVAKIKMPDSKVAGEANVFIFPNLSCGNIAYKAVQRCANALAIGPVLQGLKKPVNDLSRGCLMEDIVNTVLITAIQANGEK